MAPPASEGWYSILYDVESIELTLLTTVWPLSSESILMMNI